MKLNLFIDKPARLRITISTVRLKCDGNIYGADTLVDCIQCEITCIRNYLVLAPNIVHAYLGY